MMISLQVFYDKDSYEDSSLSSAMSELPLVSRLLYLSPYIDSPLSYVANEVVVLQCVNTSDVQREEYELFSCKIMSIFRLEAKLLLMSDTATSFSPLDCHKMTCNSAKRFRFIYVKPSTPSFTYTQCSSESYGTSATSCEHVSFRDEVTLFQSKGDDVLNLIQKCINEAMSDVNKSNTIGVVQALEDHTAYIIHHTYIQYTSYCIAQQV